MTKIPLGKKCSVCGRIHVCKTLEDLSSEDKKKVKKLSHRIFDRGYIGSLVKDNEVWEFYRPLTKIEAKIDVSQPKPTEEEESIEPYESTEFWQQEMDWVAEEEENDY